MWRELTSLEGWMRRCSNQPPARQPCNRWHVQRQKHSGVDYEDATPSPIIPLLVWLPCIALAPSVDGNTIHLMVFFKSYLLLETVLYRYIPSFENLSWYKLSRTPLGQRSFIDSLVIFRIKPTPKPVAVCLFEIILFKAKNTFNVDAKLDLYFTPHHFTLKLTIVCIRTTASNDGLQRYED